MVLPEAVQLVGSGGQCTVLHCAVNARDGCCRLLTAPHLPHRGVWLTWIIMTSEHWARPPGTPCSACPHMRHALSALPVHPPSSPTVVMVFVFYFFEIAAGATSNRFAKGWGGVKESSINTLMFSFGRCGTGGSQLSAQRGGTDAWCACDADVFHSHAPCRKGPTLGEVLSTPARCAPAGLGCQLPGLIARSAANVGLAFHCVHPVRRLMAVAYVFFLM